MTSVRFPRPRLCELWPLPDVDAPRESGPVTFRFSRPRHATDPPVHEVLLDSARTSPHATPAARLASDHLPVIADISLGG